MNRNINYRSITIRVFVLAALAVACGCASSPNAKDTVDSMSAFGNETAKAKDSIDAAVNALETLTSSEASQIKPNLEAYSKSVKSLDEQAKLVVAEAEKMKENGDSYFATWEEGSANITAERHAELSATYTKIKAEMAAAKNGFAPFLASLKDVEAYVTLDPTLKGITSMSGLTQKAKDNSVDVKSQLDTVLNDLNSVRGMLSTKEK